MLLKIFNLYKGFSLKFVTYRGNVFNDELNSFLNKYDFDLGVSKLGFKVRDNIISSFKNGLLNDHNAILPLFRGRSVVEFSILHGLSYYSTVHFIDGSIDTGGILKIFDYSKLTGKSMEEIKAHLKESSHERLLSVITGLNNNTNVKRNKFAEGLTYYSIHPFIYKHIINRIN